MGKGRNFGRQQVRDRMQRQGRVRATDAAATLFPSVAPAPWAPRPGPLSKAELRAQAEAAFRSFKGTER